MIRIMVMLVLLCGGPPLCWALPGAGEVHQGNEAYRKGDYKAALTQYNAAADKSPSDARIDHDKAAAFYKDGRYQDAIEYWNRALLTDDDKLRRSVHYDLGNAFYKNGTGREDKDIEGAIKDLTSSVAEFGTVVAADSKDEDAKLNQSFVGKELERLKQKKQQQQQQQSQDQQGKGQQSKDQQDKGQQGKDQQSKEQQSKESSTQDQQSGRQGTQDKARQEKAEKDQAQPQEDQQQGDRAGKDESGKKPEGQSAADKKTPDQKGGASGQKDGEKILSRDEAEMLLNDFDQNEQPKGLLNFTREERQESPVGKDW